MSGTNYSNGGRRSVTRRALLRDARVRAFALGVGVLVLGIVWLQRSVDWQMARLEQEFGTLSAENFFVGVQMSARFRSLNEQLLEYHLTQTAADRESFFVAAEDLKQWLKARQASFKTARERELFDETGAAYDGYLVNTRPLMEAVGSAGKPPAFAKTFKTVHRASERLVSLTEQFIGAQKAAFDVFLADSQKTVYTLRRYRTFLLGLLVVLTLALALTTYRLVIAPLRQEVSESWAIIQRQEKLSSLGTLAAGVAHEIRNPLTAIKFRLFSLKKSLPAEFSEHEDLGVIAGEINRLDRIVKDFLQFARPSEPEPVRVPAERLLREVGELLKPQLEKSGIELHLEAPGTTWIDVDTQQLKQVLVNLVQNAAHSIGRNGSVSLRVKQAEAELGGRLQPAVVLQIVDTGKGIPPKVQARLFDPFFSTKEGGTGLGLPIAARIVEKHGGLLRFDTALNRGSTFEVVLPHIEHHATQASDH